MKPPEPSTLFLDTFADPAFGTRWEALDLSTLQGPPQWSVRDGVLRQTSNCYTPGSYRGTLLMGRYPVEPPYRIRARLRSSDPDRIGLAFGFTSPEDLHLLWLSASRPERALVRVRAGREARLAARRAGFQLSRWYELDLLVTRRELRLHIDGERALDAETEEPVSGRVGLYCHANRGLEVTRFTLSRPVGAPAAPRRLQWQVSEEDGRQTVIRLSNIGEQDLWFNATARDQRGQPVTPGYLRGMGGADQWQRLRPGHSGSVILGPPMTKPGHGVCEITWRTREPTAADPLLVSAYATDQRGLGWMIPVI